MSGPENAHAGGGFDLLRRATQAMMSKTAAPEEDGADHIGYETPRSGIATPHPDPHDKRLPGITTYFSQSGPPTPTRALSTANSQSDGRDTPSGSSGSGNDGAETSGTVTPKNSGTDVPTAKGKLTIKIIEARGIRRSRDPYVVAVFQRSELISGGPHAIEDEEQVVGTPSGLGSIPMKRQVSDSGRPMAIPMRSRQSSNTSISDHNTFRNRTLKTLFSSPKWDAEAVL
jgi:protein-serine/threonine kinase